MAKCFVIMPYGGEDPEKKKLFFGIYASIIKPAASRVGMDVIRSDLKQEPGSITADIIRDLAAADIVIADLTESNPNVFFELGIRHVLRKSGTVHIADVEASLPFDVAPYRVVRYSTQLADLETSISQLAEAIDRRMKQPGQSDNPVHDTLPALPINYLATTSEALQNDLSTMQQTITKLEREREDLVQRLAQAGISVDFTSDAWSPSVVDALLEEAAKITKLTGPNALLRLAKAQEEHDTEAFLRELNDTLKSPYLDENDLSEISNRCGMLGLTEYQRGVLIISNRRFPRNQVFLLHLAQSYLNSPSPAIKEQGRQILERLLGVVHTSNDGITIETRPKVAEASGIVAVLTDAYTDLSRHDWSVQLCDAAIKFFGASSSFLRNKARALAELGEVDQAEKVFGEAIKLDPKDDTAVSFYANFLYNQGRYEDAYEMHEKALLLDMDDPSRWRNIAIHISNCGIVAAENGDGFIGPIPESERIKLIMPLIIASLEGGVSATTISRTVGYLIRAGAVEEAEVIASGGIPIGEYNDYLVKRIKQKSS